MEKGKQKAGAMMVRKKESGRDNADDKKPKLLADQAVALAEYAARALVAAEQLRIKGRPVEGLRLLEGERAALTVLPNLPPKCKKTLANPDAALTVAEVAAVTMAAAEALPDAEPKQQVGLLLIAKKLMDSLQANVVMPAVPAKGTRPKPAAPVYQFKVTLIESRPPVWRRIQVKDCTLNTFHEHLQTAMGWTNSHLHHFRVGDQLYGDPELMQENFEELGYKDSTVTRLSDIVPKAGKRFRFVYEYDFGDSWDHDVLFEGRVEAEPGARYPLCLKGARACPPEDVGGVWGYADFLEAVQNPDNEQHEDMREWVGGAFDPDAFDPAVATKAMKKGLPDWRTLG